MSTSFQWNQVELTNFDPMNQGLLSILAFDRDDIPRPVGTGFIALAEGTRAVAFTASHVLDAVARMRGSQEHQRQPSRTMDLDKDRVRALALEKSRPELAIIDWAVWDYATDIAFFGVRTQSNEIPDYFGSKFLITDEVPSTGDEIGVLGFQGMATKTPDKDPDNWHRFHVERQLLLRTGRVTAVHKTGYRLCKWPCIETTIPVFPGMSGGPVMRFAPGKPMEALGLVTSDFNADEDQKNDRRIAGESMVTLLQAMVKRKPDGTRDVILQVENAFSEGELPGMLAGGKCGVSKK